MYKIKQKPEDFFVKEISNVKFGKKGNYAYFLLKKKNYTTIRALQHIAGLLRVHLKRFGFAGSKDRNAVTEQVVSVRDIGKERLERVNLKDIEIKFLGKGNKPVSLGDLEGNYFRIIVKDADKEPKKLKKFRNLFGEQRFSKNNSLIGKAIVKKDFRNAVELVLENKGDTEAIVMEHRKQKPNDFVGALRKIPLKILKMYVHAYQSFLWNKIAEKTGKEEIPLIGFGTVALDKEIKELMEEECITTRDFIIKEMPELSSEGDVRKVFAGVKDFNMKKIDEKTVELTFILPKGSYATVFIKELFG